MHGRRGFIRGLIGVVMGLLCPWRPAEAAEVPVSLGYQETDRKPIYVWNGARCRWVRTWMRGIRRGDLLYSPEEKDVPIWRATEDPKLTPADTAPWPGHLQVMSKSAGWTHPAPSMLVEWCA